MLVFLASKRNLAMLFFKILNQLANHMIDLPINATSFIVCDIVQLIQCLSIKSKGNAFKRHIYTS